MTREASVERNTKETEIKLKINLDGTGYSDIETGVGSVVADHIFLLTECLQNPVNRARGQIHRLRQFRD